MFPWSPSSSFALIDTKLPINLSNRSKTKEYLLNAIPWVVAFMFWLPFAFFGFDASTPTDGDRLIGILLLSLPVIMTIIPLVIITVLYARILNKIQNSLGAQHVKDKFDMKSSGCEERPNTGTNSSNGGSNLAPHHQSQDGSKIAMKSTGVHQTGQNKKVWHHILETCS